MLSEMVERGLFNGSSHGFSSYTSIKKSMQFPPRDLHGQVKNGKGFGYWFISALTICMASARVALFKGLKSPPWYPEIIS